MRVLGLVALLTLFVAAPAYTQVEGQEQTSSEIYTRTAKLFAVDGQRRLNMFCIGNGTPTIVFISGAWESTTTWRRVQEPAARLSHACSYDRAGLGFSDPATRPSTAQNAVDDLKKLLDAANIKAPVVLVGHSAGGLYAMLFTALYSDRVAGVVLVDPSDPEANHDRTTAGHLTPEVLQESRRQTAENLGHLRHCVDLAREGRLTPNNTDPYCLMTETDPVLKAELDRQHARLQTKEAILSEMISLDASVEGEYSLSEVQYRRAIGNRSFGKLPLILPENGGVFRDRRS